MIKTNILSNEKINGLNWLIVFAAVSGSVFLRSIILNKSYAAPLEIIIWYPLIAVCCFLSVEFFAKIFFADWFAINSQKYFLSILFAIVIGFVISFLPFWGQVASGMPLTLAQSGGYLLTLGVYPLTVGPDGLLRGLTWGLTLALGFFMYKNTGDIFKTISLSLITWLSMTIIILLPSIVLMATFAFKSLPMAWSNTDLVSEFTRINLFSYWADGQILRWFTGFGSQAVNAMLLYTGSVVYIVGSIFWAIINFQWIKRLLSALKISNALPILPVVLFGYQAGLSRQGWVGIDWAAWSVLFILVVFIWLQAVSFFQNVDLKDRSLIVLGLLGGLLLGWSVFLTYLSLLLLIYIVVELKKIDINLHFLNCLYALFWPLLALLIALFMQRGDVLSSGALKTLAVLVVFTIAVPLFDYAKNTEQAKLKVLFIWFVWAVLLWIITGIFAPVAIMLLAGVCLWIFWQKLTSKNWFLPVFIWSVALFILFFVIRLSELAKI